MTLGEGKFSVVFKAERISDSTQVALKLIKVKLPKIYRITLDLWYERPKTERQMHEGSQTTWKIATWIHNMIHRKLYRTEWDVHYCRMGRKRGP